MSNNELINWLKAQMSEVSGSIAKLQTQALAKEISMLVFDNDNAYWRGLFQGLESVLKKLES